MRSGHFAASNLTNRAPFPAIIPTMRFLIRAFFFLLLIAIVAAGGAYFVAGRMPGPAIEIARPEKFVGVATPLEVVVSAPGAAVSTLQIALEQNGKQTPLYTKGDTTGAAPRIEGDRIVITRELGRQTVPDISPAPARIIVTTARPVLRGIRTVESTATRDLQVRLERPRVSVVSTHHYVNLGGTEMVLYRVSPEDVESGVLVGNLEYPGYPATGARGAGRLDCRSRPARGLLRAALRPGRPHADARVRPGRRRQQRPRRLRLHGVPEAVQAQPHRARRQVPRPRRAGHPRRHAGESSPKATRWRSSS